MIVLGPRVCLPPRLKLIPGTAYMPILVDGEGMLQRLDTLHDRIRVQGSLWIWLDSGYNGLKAVTYFLPTTCPSFPQRCSSQKDTQIVLHIKLHLRVCILRQLARNSCIGYECQLLSPIIRYHHGVYFSLLLHICDSFL